MTHLTQCPLPHKSFGCIEVYPPAMGRIRMWYGDDLTWWTRHQSLPRKQHLTITTKQPAHGTRRTVEMQCPLCGGTEQVPVEYATAWHMFVEDRWICDADDITALRRSLECPST